ncbi:hypothetical protein DMX01_17725 [Pseudomonas fulva]|nr:hypothetical protein DMX01_17725 [Pseudomonas fulva]
MVSVPREPSAQMLDAARSAPVPMVHFDSMRARQDLKFSARYKAAISQCTQPAPQPHPDPIAWMVGTAFWWTKEEAERDAAETGLPIVPVGPLSGGVEAEQLREVIKHSDAQIMRQSMRISNQRAQLAEAHALLRDSSGKLVQMAAYLIGAPLRGLHDLQDEDKRMTRPRVDSAVDFADARLKDAAYEIRRIANALSASAEPSAPAEIDERAEFEQACRDAATARGRELDPEALRRRADGSHVNPLTECGWWGWQARAALGRKPQVKL